jgi:gamma-glutamyltranspeptidase/glutathione hydrolase
MRAIPKILALLWLLLAGSALAAIAPVRARHGMVVSQNAVAAQVGVDVLQSGGTAVDAAVAVALALAVVYPTAGNIGGGGFMVYRPARGEAVAYDFRETAPAAASATMFLKDGGYDKALHHDSALSVGVPGTVAGLHLAWKENGKLPWERLVGPAIRLAHDGFTVTDTLARSLKKFLPDFEKFPASAAQFTKQGAPYEIGDLLRQPDLARTLTRIAEQGPAGFYGGETARLIKQQMQASGGLITRADLVAYRAKRRRPMRGTYRGYEVISMPPPSSGGVALIEMLNILEGYDLAAMGFGSAAAVHTIAESMRRAYADRALHLGDPDFNPDLPIERLISKDYAAELRATIDPESASKSDPGSFEWPPVEHPQTTHFSIVDSERNAVSMTYTLEDYYGSKMVVSGAGFLLNNEMGDFNAGPGLTNSDGLIGTEPNLAAPGKRMLSSMTPTLLAQDGKLFLVIGSPGGRTIIHTVLLNILNVIDFGMNIREANDAPRFHHQWLPDLIRYEQWGLSPDTVALLEQRGHSLKAGERQGSAAGILVNAEDGMLEGASDRSAPDGAALGH